MARLHALQLADMRAMERQGVRENPIRRNAYALQGGAAPTEPLDFALASRRAMEIQHNRQNPHRKGATPTMGVSQVRGGVASLVQLFKPKKVKGGRAVPSTGLSQFRGGSNGVIVGGGMGSDSDEEYEGCGRDTEIMARESARRPVIRSGLSDQHSVEAKEMGKHLGNHLMSMRGGGFYDLFTKGIVEAGRQGASVAEYTGMPNPNSTPAATSDSYVEPSRINVNPEDEPPAEEPPTEKKGSGAMFYRSGDMSKDEMEHHKEHTARRFGMTRKGAGIMDSPSMQRFLKQEKAREMARSGVRLLSKGGFLSGPYEGMGMLGEDGHGQQRGRGKLTIIHGSGPARRAKRASKTPAQKEHQKKMKHEAQMRMAEDALDEEDEGIRRRVGQPLLLEVAPSIPRPFARRAEAHPRSAQSDLTLTGERMDRGSGKKRRAPAGPSDGRRKRAEIVKKVMAEQGMKMIEASKYVKEHNLF